MGKSTVVSALPFQLTENKPGLFPSRYVIPAAPKGDISTLVVEDACFFEHIPFADDKIPPRKVPILSDEVARGLCQDYINANLAVEFTPDPDGTIAVPGIFYVDGAMTPKFVKDNHKAKVDQAQKNTAAWFLRLVKLADDDWQRYHQHKGITDLQRSACKYLGIPREWNIDIFELKSSLCWSCKTSVNPEAIICSCNAILNAAAYEANKDRYVGGQAAGVKTAGVK